MNARMTCFIGALGALLLATALPAAAKSVNMPALSRSSVEAACHRAGGAAYGISDPQSSYGCTSRLGSVDCSADGRCEGSVYDLRPVPANSLEAVLGAGVHAGPTKIGPSDRRITPVATQP